MPDSMLRYRGLLPRGERWTMSNSKGQMIDGEAKTAMGHSTSYIVS